MKIYMEMIENHQQIFTDNINIPCVLCRRESISSSKNKYCRDCYIDLIGDLFPQILKE